MAKKKAAIGDLIKSDMSKRTIKEDPKTTEETRLFSSEESAKKPETEEITPPVSEAVYLPAVMPAFVAAPSAPDGSAELMALISEQTRSAGLTDKTDLYNFYAFMQDQAIRYIMGFDAGRRFRG